MATHSRTKVKTLTDATLTEVFAAHAAGVAETVIHSLTICNTSASSIDADITVEDVKRGWNT